MKNKINKIFAGLGIVALAYGAYPVFMLLFILAALSRPLQNLGYLSACVTSCELNAITTTENCNASGGLKAAYWVKASDVDLTSMSTDPLAFDTATEQVLDWTMNGGAVFTKLTFERKQGFYDFTFTEDTDVYEQLVTLIFEGKSNANRLAFCKALSCCQIILHLIDNDCNERVVGIEWDGSLLDIQVKSLRMGRHLDSSGQLGTSAPRDELDLVGESICSPLFATVGEANIPV